jgi:hypothetical protein
MVLLRLRKYLRFACTAISTPISLDWSLPLLTMDANIHLLLDNLRVLIVEFLNLRTNSLQFNVQGRQTRLEDLYNLLFDPFMEALGSILLELLQVNLHYH